MPTETNEPTISTMTLDPVEIEKENAKKVEEEQVLRLRGGNLGYYLFLSRVDVLGAIVMRDVAGATGLILGIAAVKLRCAAGMQCFSTGVDIDFGGVGDVELIVGITKFN